MMMMMRSSAGAIFFIGIGTALQFVDLARPVAVKVDDGREGEEETEG